MFLIRFCQHGSNSRQKFRPVLEYESRDSDINITASLLFKYKGIKDTSHSMRIKNLILGFNKAIVLYFICYESSLKNDTDIIKNTTASLLQNTKEFYSKCVRFFITKCNSFIKKCNSFIKNCEIFIKNCDSCYKLRELYYKMHKLVLFDNFTE